MTKEQIKRQEELEPVSIKLARKEVEYRELCELEFEELKNQLT